MRPDVFVTGLGVVSPAGSSTAATWSSLLSGGRFVTSSAEAGQPGEDPCAAGRVAESSFPGERGGAGRLCRFALAAAEEALASAGMTRTGHLQDTRRVCLSLSTSKGVVGLIPFALCNLLNPPLPSTTGSLANSPEDSVDPLSPLRITPDLAARHVAAKLGITAGSHVSVGACATGALAVVRGVRLIQDGDADIVLCGGADASVHPLWLAALRRMGVLASGHPKLGSAWACRPFDRTRSGFVVGEGAAVLVLESACSLRQRGAEPVARIAGCALGTDPTGLTRVARDGRTLARVIELAYQDAGLSRAATACVLGHGTGTVANDLAEARALRQVFGDRICGIPLVSLKGAVGHLLGAAGALETAVAALACRASRIPGTATLVEPDPELGLLNLPTAAVTIGHGAILKTSMGFGGHLAAIVVAPA